MAPAIFKKNSLEQTGFSVTDDGFNYKGRFYPLSEVAETRSYRVIHQTWHIPINVTVSHNPAFSFVLVMRDGEILQVTEQSTLVSSSKQEKVEELQEAYDFICEKTFEQRAMKYISQIEENGYFQYGVWRFSTNQQKIIDTSSGKGYPVSELSLLRSYGFIEIVPKNESSIAKALRKSKNKLSGTRYGISTLSDGDVFFALLYKYFRLKW